MKNSRAGINGYFYIKNPLLWEWHFHKSLWKCPIYHEVIKSPLIYLLLAILSICSPQTKGEIPSWYYFHFQSFFPVKYTNLNFAFLNLLWYIFWYILLIVMHAIHKWHMKYSQVKSKNINWKSEVIVLFGSFQAKSIVKK